MVYNDIFPDVEKQLCKTGAFWEKLAKEEGTRMAADDVSVSHCRLDKQ